MDSEPGFPSRQSGCPRGSASLSSPGPSLSNARPTPCGDEPARKKARRDGGGPENNANIRQDYGFTNSSASGSARAHFGNNYSHVYNYNKSPSPASRPNCDSDGVAQIMESLSFSQMDVRRDTISRAHSTTCKWIFDRQEYIDWRDENLMSDHCGFFWIKSKPGAGKSTLMNFLLQSAREHIPDDTVISFFFNARGEELERSLEGCYRGLLHDLLTKVPRLQAVLQHSKIHSNSLRQWSLVSLRKMFSAAILLLGHTRLTCFIDALDECPEADVRDMVDFFEELGELAAEKSIRFRICLSSRYYPQVSIANCRHMQLDQLNGHQDDIAKYVKSKLKIHTGKIADELRTAVQDKAQGIFMWVVVVVRILNEASDHGSNNSALRECLERLPSELHELFRDILLRGIQDNHNLIRILQWISFSQRPLTREELYFAIRSDKPDFVPSIPWEPFEDVPEAMDRFILNATKGLAETTKRGLPVVQFIHESVRDFLCDTGFDIVAPDLSSSLQGSTHDYIKQCCYRWISEEMEIALSLPRPLPATTHVDDLGGLRIAAETRFPFLEYSVKNVLRHAELAWLGGISQQHFIEEFRWSPWTRINALLTDRDCDRYTTPEDSLAFVLAHLGASMLLKAELQLNLHCLSDSQLDAVFLMCLCNQETQMFMEALESGPPRVSFQLRDETFELAVGRRDLDTVRMVLERGLYVIKSESSDHVLGVAAGTGNMEILQLLFEHGAVITGTQPMYWTCRKGRERVLPMLISHGADVNARFYDGMAPLATACFLGHSILAQRLIEHGAYITKELVHDMTLLGRAVFRQDEDLAQLLLQYGANPDLPDEDQMTPLIRACSGGHGNMSRMLLEKDADPNLVDGTGRTPLLQACYSGHEDIVRMLLEKDADPNLVDWTRGTPLLAACLRDNETIVRILLEKGAHVNSGQNKERILVTASFACHNNMLQTLFLHGLDPNIRNGSDYLRAISVASRRGHDQVIKTLLANSAGVQHQEPDSYREVVQAVTMAGHGRILELLLSESEGFRAQDKAIYSDSLRQAKERGLTDIVKILQERGVTLPEDMAT